MDFNKLLSKLFGSKATRDMKLIQPWVEKIKAVSPAIEALTHDELRAKTRELQHNIQSSADDLNQQISEIRAKIEETPIEEREQLFTQIDKLEKQVLERMDVALEEALPEAFAIVKDTARRFATNETIKVTATDYDRELAVTKDFVELDEDGVHAIYHNHWVAGGNDLKWEWCTTTCSFSVGSCLPKVRLLKWPPVKVRRLSLPALFSSVRFPVAVYTS